MNKKRIMLLAGTLITLIVICINLILVIKILPGSGYGRNQKKLEQARTFSIPSSGKRMQLEQEENNKNQEQIEIEEKEQELAKLIPQMLIKKLLKDYNLKNIEAF